MRRPNATLLCLLLAFSIWWAGVSPAEALDDGGGRSVFAIGAGNRALAMGGAFGAVADDASAPLWNPAGVGLLQRRQLAATHTNLFGMGFSEQYLVLGYPHWRWGSFALTLRIFGVDGIEERDDRNVLLSDDLKDRETELNLAYGRRLRRGLLAGAALKIQRQALAGYAAGGFGLDLGVLAYPGLLFGDENAERGRWSCGATIRNMLEPAQRLDVESVPDPRGVRLGTAWRQRLSPELALLTAVDLEQTRGMDGRWHLGAEVDYRRILALRTGSMAGSWTAGFGVSWRDLAVDYAYESNRLGDIQRIGLTVAFGRSVTQAREEARRRIERERQQRLDAAFAADTQRRITELLDAARLAAQAGSYDKALDQVAMVRMLDADNADASVMESDLLRSRAADQEQQANYADAIVTLNRLQRLLPDDERTAESLARIRGLSDQRASRSRAIRDLFNRGLDTFAAGDLLQARDSFRQVKELNPDDADADAMLTRTEQAISQKILALHEEARGLAKAGLFAEALQVRARSKGYGAVADSLTSLDSFIEGLKKQKDLEDALRRRNREREARLTQLSERAQEVPAAAENDMEEPALTPVREKELTALARRADGLFDQDDATEAVKIWELIWSEAPELGDVAQKLSREYLSRGMEAFAAGRLDEAVGIWEQALRVDPEDQRARSYLQRARQQAARIRRMQEENGR